MTVIVRERKEEERREEKKTLILCSRISSFYLNLNEHTTIILFLTNRR
jgi:hypothetical protein